MFRTVEAINYIHSMNVYYGDMKEENVLVFRDYSIKLGDFGVSVTMNNSEEEFNLKGMSKGYVTPVVQLAFNDNSYKVTRKDLILNDYFALYVTYIRMFNAF